MWQLVQLPRLAIRLCEACSPCNAGFPLDPTAPTNPPPPQVLRLVIRLYEGVPQPDLTAICQCHMFLGDAEEVAAILARLLGCVLVWWWVCVVGRGGGGGAILSYRVEVAAILARLMG